MELPRSPSVGSGRSALERRGLYVLHDFCLTVRRWRRDTLDGVVGAARQLAVQPLKNMSGGLPVRYLGCELAGTFYWPMTSPVVVIMMLG